jgi:transposase
VLSLTAATRIYLYRGATDMRRSFNGLSGMVRQHFSADLLSGNVFVFVNRRKTLVKLLYFETGGMAIWMKRLERGTFQMPQGPAGEAELSAAELSMLLEGITPLRINRRWQPAVSA